MNIRRAVPNDSGGLSALCVDVQSLHAEHHPDIFKTPADEDFAVTFFDEALVDPLVNIFIAEENGNPCGYVLARIVERPENIFTHAMRYLLLDQISVHPSAQGRGVGGELLKQVDLLAKQLDLQRIQLDSWDFNLTAHAFFERSGFQKFMFRFWRFI